MLNTIKSKIVLVLMFIILILGVLMFILSSDTYSKYQNLKIDQTNALVASEAEQINKSIIQIEKNAIDLALQGEVFYRTKSSPESMKKMIMRNFESSTAALGGGVWFEPYVIDPAKERVCFYAYKKGGKVVYEPKYETPEYNYPKHNWYITTKKHSLKKDALVWTPPYTDNAGSNALMTTVGVGIFDANNKFVGMSTVDWEIELLVEEISQIKPTPNSFTLMADPANDFIVVLTDESVKETPVGKSLKTIPWLKDNISNESQFKYNGVKYLSFQKKLANGVILIVNTPKDELFEEINNSMRVMAGIMLLSVLLVFYSMYRLLNHLISKPVVYLSKKAIEIGAGNLDVQVELHTRDEFTTLADSFNKMTQDIKDYTQNIKSITAEKERISTELDIARDIQSSMIPSIFPPFPDRSEFDIYASMIPAKAVGGDFYDFFFIDKDHLAIVIADVSDKGVPAALFMMIAKTLIKNYAQLNLSPGQIFEKTNLQLCENNDLNMFVTAFLGILNISNGEFVYANAGHNPPLIKRHNESFKPLEVQPFFVLGGVPVVEYREGKINLGENDTIFMYTDGVTDAENPQSQFFGIEKLIETLNNSTYTNMQDLIGEINYIVNSFAAGEPQSDDMTMLAMHYCKKTGAYITTEKTFDADVKYLPEVMGFVSQELENIPKNISPKIITQLELSVEEIFANIVSYAYQENDKGKIKIQILTLEEDDVAIRISDSGIPYNPLDTDAPDTSLNLYDRKVGGLGIFIAKQNTDILQYDYINGQNILTLIKRIG